MDDVARVADLESVEDGNGPTWRPVTEADLIDAADYAFALSEDWYDCVERLHQCFKQLGIDPDDLTLQPLRHAVGFHLDDTIRSGRRTVELNRVDYLLERWAARHPRDVDDVTAQVWRRIADNARHPAARARFADLLVLRGGPGTPARAAAAARAYADLVEQPETHNTVSAPPGRSADGTTGTAEAAGSEESDDTTSTAATVVKRWRDRELSTAIGRALSLLHIVEHGPTADVATRVEKVAVEHARRCLNGDAPGAAIEALELLLHQRPNVAARHADVAALIDRGLDPNKPFLFDRYAQLAVTLAPERRHELDERRVRIRIDEASTREPMSRMILLEKACALARTLGLDDLVAETTVALQQIDKSDFGLSSITSEASLPRELVEAEIGRMSQGSTWQEALTSWLSTGSPTGDAVRNQQTAVDLVSNSIRALIMPTVRSHARWEYRGLRTALSRRSAAVRRPRAAPLPRSAAGRTPGWLLDRGVGTAARFAAVRLATGRRSCPTRGTRSKDRHGAASRCPWT